MLNVIKSEIYKTGRRAYLYIFVGVISALGLALGVMFAVANRVRPAEYYTGFESVAAIVIMMLSAGIYFTLPFVDMVFSEEYKNLTMKNMVSYGTPRTSIYLGKLAVEILFALLGLAVMMTIILGGAFLLMGTQDMAKSTEMLGNLLVRLAVSIPLWIGALCTGNMLAFLIRNSVMYVMIFLAWFGVVPEVLKGLGALVDPVFYQIRSCMIPPLFDLMPGALSLDSIVRCVVVGLAHAVVFTVIGVLLFRKKEIK